MPNFIFGQTSFHDKFKQYLMNGQDIIGEQSNRTDSQKTSEHPSIIPVPSTSRIEVSTVTINPQQKQSTISTVVKRLLRVVR